MPSAPCPEPYPSVGRYWRARFGQRVQRVSLDAGFSCPNRDGTVGTAGCAFCDPASFSPSAGDPRSVAEQLDDGIARLRGRGIRLAAAYFQPNTNTHASLERLAAVWDAAAARPEVAVLCVGTRPDSVPEPVLDLLASYADRFEIWLELGLQSAHDRTLERLGRGHGARAFASASRRARGRGLRVCAHVILGLPGEGPTEERVTADRLAGWGVDGVKLHRFAVVAGTALEAPWRRGELAVLDEAGYAERAVAFLSRLPRATVVHRLVGDTRGGRLLAPRFDKGRVVRAIRHGLGGR